ncbi:hypothetical protein IPH19_02375 [Candidatus Uhrbacteria bacterium]|nr:MAG: hypothetical protein IPH19_02375 [Candidatus Uhrbacteria bacterium]
MNNPESAHSYDDVSSAERVSLDAKLKKNNVVAFDAKEIQRRIERMQALETKIVPDQTNILVGLRRELETLNKEYLSLKEVVDMGMAKFSDLQRLEAVQGELQTLQSEVVEAEGIRAELRRELALLNPDEYGDLYQLERAQAEASKNALNNAVAAMDESMLDEIHQQIKKKKN